MFKRALPKKPATRKVKVSFNGETLSAYYAVTDSRTSDEKWLNQKNGRLSGPVIVFFQGHAQRPADIFPFTAELSFRQYDVTPCLHNRGFTCIIQGLP